MKDSAQRAEGGLDAAGAPGFRRTLPSFAGCCLILLTFLAAWPPTARAGGYDWQVGLSYTRMRGDYGTDEVTTMTYVPVKVKRFFEQFEVSVTVPWISLETGGSETLVGGVVQSVDVDGEGESGSGLGDILLKGAYFFLEQEGMRPYLDLTAKVKIPTADEGAGLGTGEFDFGFGAEASYRIRKVHLAFMDLGYTFIGDPPGTDYSNQALFGIGYGYHLNPNILLSGFYEVRNALKRSKDGPQSFMICATWKLRPDLRAQILIDIGLSDGSADSGVTVGLTRRF